MSRISREYLHQLTTRRDQAQRDREALVRRADREGRTKLTRAESSEFQELCTTVDGLDEHITDVKADLARMGGAEALRARLGGGGLNAAAYGSRWAEQVSRQLREAMGSEHRAVISGSLDVPSLVEPNVTDIPHPARLIDLFTNRLGTESNAFTYYQQTARTNAATAVADFATKPTSTLTVRAVDDRCRVIAHLSEPVPLRIWHDHDAFMYWLQAEMVAGVLDGLEAQIISGGGTGENMTSLLSTPGTTTVAFNTNAITTLRSAVTALQNLGEVPTGWALNPADAQAVDLERWGTSGGLLTGGYEFDDGAPSSSNVFGGPVKRVVSPSVPQGTAILGDWTKLRVYVREETHVDLDVSGELFDTNTFKARGEGRFGIGVLRPQAFAICDLTE